MKKHIVLRGYTVKSKRIPKGSGFVHYAKWQILEKFTTATPEEIRGSYPNYKLKLTPIYTVSK